MQNTWSDPPGYGGGRQLALPTLTPCVKRLLIATCAVFLFQFALSFGGRPVVDGFTRWFGLYPPAWRSLTPPIWQVLTYGFLHDVNGFGHILFNMLWLYFLGTMLEAIIGARRFLAVYLGGMLAGGVLQLAVSLVGDGRPTVGASGATLAVTIAMATLRPQTTIIFLIFPITLRTLAIIVVGMDLFGILISVRDGASGATAYFAHFGGALFGFVMAKRGLLWKDPFSEVGRRLEDRREKSRVEDQRQVDELLAKIHREGIQALSSREKAFLKRVSKR